VGGRSTAVRSSYRRKRQWTVAAKDAGGNGDGGEAVGAVKRWRPWSQGWRVVGRLYLDSEAGKQAHPVSFFSNLSKTGSNCQIKIYALFALKITTICMRLSWNILNNFLNWADFKFPT
jgi:hypothetical protein